MAKVFTISTGNKKPCVLSVFPPEYADEEAQNTRIFKDHEPKSTKLKTYDILFILIVFFGLGFCLGLICGYGKLSLRNEEVVTIEVEAQVEVKTQMFMLDKNQKTTPLNFTVSNSGRVGETGNPVDSADTSHKTTEIANGDNRTSTTSTTTSTPVAKLNAKKPLEHKIPLIFPTESLDEKTARFPRSYYYNTENLIKALGSPKCPMDWVYFEQTNSCYLPIEKQIRWADAEQECIRMGSHLASIHSDDEWNFIREFSFPYLERELRGDYSSGIWLGIRLDSNRVRGEIKGYNVDGTPLNYTNFACGEPNYYEPGEDCVMYYPTWLPGMSDTQTRYYIGKMNDDRCTWRKSYGYICKKPAQEGC